MRNRQSTTVMKCPVGKLLLAAEGDFLTRVRFLGAEHEPTLCTDDAEASEVLAAAKRQLVEYFDGHRQTFDLPLQARGTEFQRVVWSALQDIPFGETISYGELARRVDRPQAVRAVGAANGANPLPIVVPCHRVIGADRRLTGFAGGLPVKETLLELEGGRILGGRLV